MEETLLGKASGKRLETFVLLRLEMCFENVLQKLLQAMCQELKSFSRCALGSSGRASGDGGFTQHVSRVSLRRMLRWNYTRPWVFAAEDPCGCQGGSLGQDVPSDQVVFW